MFKGSNALEEMVKLHHTDKSEEERDSEILFASNGAFE